MFTRIGRFALLLVMLKLVRDMYEPPRRSSVETPLWFLMMLAYFRFAGPSYVDSVLAFLIGDMLLNEARDVHVGFWPPSAA